MDKHCARHGTTRFKALSRGRGKGKQFVCVKCLQARKDKVRKERKKKLVVHAGGKCVCCNYRRCVAALDFHHLDKATKLFKLSLAGVALAACLEELKKCVLLCRNCHAEVEVGFEPTLRKLEMFLSGDRSSIG